MDSFSLSSVVEYSQKGQCLRDSLHKECFVYFAELEHAARSPR